MVNIELALRPASEYPSELNFDANWYRKTYRLNSDWPADNIEDYYRRKGAARGDQLSPYFNAAFVKFQLQALGVECGDDPRDAYLQNAHRVDPHPILFRSPRGIAMPNQEALGAAVEWFNASIFVLRNHDDLRTRHSIFFDPDYITDELGRVVDRPLDTYLQNHTRGNIQVSALFDPEFYGSLYPDVSRHISDGGGFCQNLLQHFIVFGAKEGRLPFADLDVDYYARTYPDVSDRLGDLNLTVVQHFMFHGIFEQRDPNPYFSSDFYVDYQPHVAEQIEKFRLSGPFEHFLKFGYKAGYRANQPLYSVNLPEHFGKIAYEKKCEAVTQKAMRDRKTITFPETESPRISCIIPVVNQGHMTVNLLEQMSSICWRQDTPDIEVILVDNGSSDITCELPNATRGLTIIRSDTPLGYPGACNRGADVARGDVLLFMNNDIEVNTESFLYGLERLETDSRVGAVGGKIVLLDGTLQEAGSILFQDGSARGVGRHDDPSRPEYNIAREVDYCSGCFLFVRRNDFQSLNGFDEVFSPGYYEEADLCFRLREKGLISLYDPRIEIRHYEYASYSKGRPSGVSLGLMRRNQKEFRQRHKGMIAELPVPIGDGWRKNWFASRYGDSLSIALAEDYIPDREIGSGFVRTADVIDELLEFGHHVTLFVHHYIPGVKADKLRQRGVEVIELFREPDGKNPLIDREWAFNVLWVCRTHNIRTWSQFATSVKAKNPDLKIVFDTEAVASLREFSYRAHYGMEQEEDLDSLVAKEVESSLSPNMVVAVNETDRAALKAQFCAPVCELGHRMIPRPDSPLLQDRQGLFFCGSFHEEDSPNFDSIKWMIHEIWPLIRAERPDVELSIVGHLSPGVRLRELLEETEAVSYLGRVPSVAAHMDSARVFVAPTRYAGGIPHKVHEAMAAGVPTVCTDLLRHQLETADFPFDDVPVLSSGPQEPAGFAELCLKLLRDDSLWLRQRDRALKFIDQTASKRVFSDRLKDVCDAL